jgi:transposase
MLNNQIDQAEQHLATVLPHTPAGVLTSLPGVGVVRASNYGAALGDPARFANADRAYRASGLVPASYESAGRPGAAKASAARATPNYAPRSSSSGAHWPSATPTSPATEPVSAPG